MIGLSLQPLDDQGQFCIVSFSKQPFPPLNYKASLGFIAFLVLDGAILQFTSDHFFSAIHLNLGDNF